MNTCKVLGVVPALGAIKCIVCTQHFVHSASSHSSFGPSVSALGGPAVSQACAGIFHRESAEGEVGEGTEPLLQRGVA